MKKIIYILVFAIILTSCNNEGTKRQDGSWLISSIDVNEKITGLMGMYYNVIDANIIAIPQGFLKPKKYLVEVTFEKNSFEFPTSEIFNPKKYTYTIVICIVYQHITYPYIKNSSTNSNLVDYAI